MVSPHQINKEQRQVQQRKRSSPDRKRHQQPDLGCQFKASEPHANIANICLMRDKCDQLSNTW